MKALKISGIIGIIILAAIWFGGRWLLSFSQATYQGKIQVTGIGHPVEITFDAKGIPQVWAQTDKDLYFALGWLHASERLFQMELIRRLARGELAEIFGPAALATDRFQREIGFARQAQADGSALRPEDKVLIQAYCDGINQWINNRKVLPPEFVILRFKPTQWQPIDCLAIALFQTWYAHGLMDSETNLSKLIEKFGPDIALLLNKYQAWSPPTLPDLKPDHSSGFSTGFSMTKASNAWTVAPDRSASGAALHASDPHLNINRVPGFWYIAGLHSQSGTEVLGITVPGLPFVLMGHNNDIAFSFTVASIDLVDFYIEKRHPQDSLAVQTPTGYQPVQIVSDTIRVRGENTPGYESIWRTSLGVVIEKDPDKLITLKWAGFDFNISDMIRAGFQLQKAQDFKEFQAAVTNMGALDVNWIYSDRQGNIGYQLGAPIPIRDFPNSFVRLAGEDSRYHWRGYRPLKQTPFVQNPEQAWLASCNNQIVSDQWPYSIPGFYDPYRIPRVAALLSQPGLHSIDDCATMQLDRVSGLVSRWKWLLIDGAKQLNRLDLAQKLSTWDNAVTPKQSLASLFALWWYFLAQVIFQDDLGEHWYIGTTIRETVLSQNLGSIIDDQNTPDVIENLTDMSARALKLALTRYDDRPYGEMNQLEISHPLSRIKLLAFWLGLNRGPFPMGGDNGSLNASWFHYHEGKNRFSSSAGASMRFLLDWSEPDQFSIYTNMGQSGNPFSPHYDDMIELWLKGGRWTVPFSKDKVFGLKKTLLTLTPVGF